MSPHLVSVAPPNAMATSQDVFARRFAGELERRGLDWRPLACEHGLHLAGPGNRVFARSEHAFARDAQLLANDPLLAWSLGDCSLRDLGLVGYAVANAPDLRSALRLLTELCDLVSEAADVALYEQHGEGTLAHRCSSNAPVSEFCLRILLCVLRELAGPDFRPLHLGVHQTDAQQLDRLADRASMPVVGLEAPVTFVSFPAGLLNRPIADADACLARTLRPLWQEECATLRWRRARMQELEAAILPLLPHGAPTRIAVAASLGIATPTLAAMLDRLGTSLPLVVDAVRAGFCSRLLARGNLPLNRAARALGFAQPEEFVHAHQRWWATPPCDGRGRRLH